MTTCAPLLNIPREQSDWDRWSFDLDQNIRDINQALLEQKGARLAEQQIYPISSDTGQWLERISGAVNDICHELNIPAADVETVDLDNDRERQAWVWVIFQELNAARGMLRI